MRILNREVRAVQNPALGAALLWSFTVGYARGSGSQSHTPLPLLFLVLPISFHEEIAQHLHSTQERSGLRAFAGKFHASSNTQSDLLLSIHDRSSQMRQLTFDSLAIAISCHLTILDANSAMVLPLSTSEAQFSIPQSVRRMLKSADKLGYWCSQLSLHEISITLKVAF